ncbi:hypothetical protein AKJ57_04355 [candidate division MSBL1 archaeon SCGC-AAA259A05]|uniref:Probable membrane transporter protein n=1 Tax=candidate division MSBL1 archaeon SCGC-AAA259A05 TaxID=1698259 RepID=A0A133U7R0_9EURY|nr:hypothetical protein AKJ57_04355 [candidate division MSBL1 archaeon SCGC-AAA259A05]
MEVILSIVVLIFAFDLLNSSAGMGLGTLSAPVLFLMGYDIHQVIPVLVIDAAISGWISGWFHQEFENVNFSFKRPLNQATRTLLIIAGIGCFTIFIGVFFTYFLLKDLLTDEVVKTYVGILVIMMAGMGLTNFREKGGGEYNPKLLTLFAGVAGLNKGISGGGYGPVMVLGEILSGVYEKTAAAISQTSEGIVSTAGAITFFTILTAGGQIDLVLLPSIFTGTFFASILAPYFVRVFPNKVWRVLIPGYALTVGSLFLIKVLLF